MLFADSVIFLQKPRGLQCDCPIEAFHKTLTAFLFTEETLSTMGYAYTSLNWLQSSLLYQAFWGTNVYVCVLVT